MVGCNVGIQPNRFALVTYDQAMRGVVLMFNKRVFALRLYTTDSNSAQATTTDGAKVDGMLRTHGWQARRKVSEEVSS